MYINATLYFFKMETSHNSRVGRKIPNKQTIYPSFSTEACAKWDKYFVWPAANIY